MTNYDTFPNEDLNTRFARICDSGYFSRVEMDRRGFYGQPIGAVALETQVTPDQNTGAVVIQFPERYANQSYIPLIPLSDAATA